MLFERYDPPIFFDSLFTQAVMAGWILTLVGCGILLLAAVWWTIAQDSSQTSPRSGLWRGLCTIGFATVREREDVAIRRSPSRRCCSGET